MKKWTWVSVLAAILLFVVLVKTGAAYSEDKIIYGEILAGRDYSCQKVHFFERDYVFIWNNVNPDADYFRVDADYSQISENIEKDGFAEILVLLRSDDSQTKTLKEKSVMYYYPAQAVKDKISGFAQWNVFLFLLLFYPVLALIFILLLNGIFEKHSIVVKYYSIAQLLLILFTISILFIMTSRFVSEYDEEIEDSMCVTAEQIKTEGSNRFKEVVKYSGVELFDCLGLNVDDNSITIVDSLRLPSNPGLTDYYGMEAEKMVKTAYQNKEKVAGILQLQNGRSNSLAYYVNEKGKGAYILFMIAPFEMLQRELNDYIKVMFRNIGIVFIICTLILLAVTLVYYKRWRKLNDAIDRVIINKEEYPIPKRRIDGFIPVWNGVSQAYRSLGSVRYDVTQGLKTSLRFVPKNLISLFERKDLTDVSIGDFKSVNGCMVQLSMDNMKSLDGGAYMNLLNTINEIVTKNQDKNNAIRIYCDPDLKKNKFFFKASADSAVAFAIDVAHELKNDPVTKVSKRLFMINKSDYNCGMSGSDEQVVPFVYSKDDEILENYEEQLRNAGVEVVLTENVLGCIENTKSVRYIGYISSNVNNRSIKLYESLDVYSEFKHKVILNTEQSFQKGLKLFYSDDFYLARNTFNEVLQINPNDQIARWYLFTCEHYLNMEGNVYVSYSLFDNRVQE